MNGRTRCFHETGSPIPFGGCLCLAKFMEQKKALKPQSLLEHHVEFGPRPEVMPVLAVEDPWEEVWNCLHPLGKSWLPQMLMLLQMAISCVCNSICVQARGQCLTYPACVFFPLNWDYFIFLDQIQNLAFSFLLQC